MLGSPKFRKSEISLDTGLKNFGTGTELESEKVTPATSATDSVVSLQQSSAGWMPASIERLSVGVGPMFPLSCERVHTALRGCAHAEK